MVRISSVGSKLYFRFYASKLEDHEIPLPGRRAALPRRNPPPFFRLAGPLLLTGAVAAAAGTVEVASLPSDLTALSLEQLMDMEVTSVSKAPEEISSSRPPPPSTSLTAEDIRRSGDD